MSMRICVLGPILRGKVNEDAIEKAVVAAGWVPRILMFLDCWMTQSPNPVFLSIIKSFEVLPCEVFGKVRDTGSASSLHWMKFSWFCPSCSN